MTRIRMAVLAGGCVLALATAGALTGCSPSGTGTSTPAESTATPPASAESTAPAALADLEVTLETVVRGLESPLFVTGAGDDSGRLFVVEQAGRVRVVRDNTLADGAFLDVSRLITSGGERGLLGLAFAPDYRTSGTFYVNYTDLDGNTVVARYVADDPADDTPVLTGPEILLTIAQPFSNHNGGCIMFEPGTTNLWVGTGDGGSGGDPNGNAQNPDSLLGKMLVLDVSGSSPKPETIQTGLRNPWRFSFDRETHDLWIADVGQDAWEEIDFAPLADARNVNWGWNLWEGDHPYPADASPSRDGFTFPIAEYGHDTGESITGGYVYRGSDYPALAGTYLYGDYVAGWIHGLRTTAPDGTALSEPEQRELVAGGEVVPSSFGEGDDGELYVCDYTGSLLKVTATAK